MWGIPMPPFIAKIIGKFAVDKLKVIEEPFLAPKMPDKLPVLSLSLDKFKVLTGHVIDSLEGGYYHPSMITKFNARSQKILAASGETMFGLDRKAGVQLSKYPEWGQFWALVDKAKKQQPNEWGYNKRGGMYGEQLKDLTSTIMYKWFSYLAGKYILISSMDEIANDDRLIIHFSYASWNGEGWFKRYAEALNKAINKYEGNKEAIYKEAIKARTESSNATIRQQGVNMLNLFKKLKLNNI